MCILNYEDNLSTEILKKIHEKTAVVGVIGLGYVGLPLAIEKGKAGFKTIGFDIQTSKVDLINAGINYIGDIIDEDLSFVVNEEMLKATSDFSLVKEVDCIAICVPTPLDEHNQPDLTYIKSSVECIGRYLHRGMLIILESTTYPGTTEELVKPLLEEISGLTCEEDFYLAFSPERVDPGNRLYKTKNTPKVVGGIGKKSTELAVALYQQILQEHIYEVSSPAVAEMEKLLENIYRNINIALINEVAIICNKMGISVWEVIEAAKTKPYGFEAFYPGPGIGGHCIPLDPFYLTWKAQEYDCHTKLIETSAEINNYMPKYIVSRSVDILNKFKKPLNGSKILILGVAYKQDIDDYRESPALNIIEYLVQSCAEVKYHDPYISECKYKDQVFRSIDLSPELLYEMDLVIITTMHTNFDYETIQKNSLMIFDTKNAMKHIKNRSNIEVL